MEKKHQQWQWETGQCTQGGADDDHYDHNDIGCGGGGDDDNNGN